MKKKRIRVVVLGVFLNRGRILVFQGSDKIKNETFFRPLGGGVEFGETSENALDREIKEELGLEIKDPRYLGALENIFVYQGEPGHEIVLVYDAQFADPKVYGKMDLRYVESDGEALRCQWLALEDIEKHNLRLYPQGLHQLLMSQMKTG
jgi:8-oxo-dGTP pyrophosphatase MutT (NUDIX family)